MRLDLVIAVLNANVTAYVTGDALSRKAINNKYKWQKKKTELITAKYSNQRGKNTPTVGYSLLYRF